MKLFGLQGGVTAMPVEDGVSWVGFVELYGLATNTPPHHGHPRFEHWMAYHWATQLTR